MTRDESEPTDLIAGLLVRELRAAVTAAIDEGADPDEVQADLVRRLHHLRHLQRYEHRPRPLRPNP
jgi:hypothetical protein